MLEILLGCLILVFKHTIYNNKFDVRRLIVSVFGGCVFEARGLNQSHGTPAIKMTRPRFALVLNRDLCCLINRPIRKRDRLPRLRTNYPETHLNKYDEMHGDRL